MTIDGPWAGDPYVMSDELATHYRAILLAHGDDPQLGACVHCLATFCPDYRYAWSQLHLAGLPLSITRSGETHTRP